MRFSQNSIEGTTHTKKNLNFNEMQPPDIKRTTASNISKNSNNTLNTGNTLLNNVVFDMNPVSSRSTNLKIKVFDRSTNLLNITKPEKERVVKTISNHKFVSTLLPNHKFISPLLPNHKFVSPLSPNHKFVSVLPSGTMQVPFPALKTKDTEVVFESNLRDSDSPQIVYFPLEKIVPVVDKTSMFETNKFVQKYLEIQKSKENHLSLKEVSRALTSEVTAPKTKEEYVTKTEVIELIKEIKEKEYVTKIEVKDLIEEIKEKEEKEYVTKIEVIDLIEERKEEYVTKIEVIDLIEERKENYAAIISEVLELNTKEFVTKAEVVDFIDATKKELLQEIDGKMYALNMEFLVEQYVTKMIERGENDEINTAEDDEPKTRFEEIIQPSVARIIHRVMRYDQSQHTDTIKNDDVSVNFEADDIYDIERQENSHFTDNEAKRSIYNPMYSNEPNVYNGEDEAIVEMGSVYNGEENKSFLFENELLKIGDRRWNRFGNGIETGNVIDLFLDKNNRKIYIVGSFKFVNRIPMKNIAVYDLTEKIWKHVGEGIPEVATAIAVDEENEIVYVGGVFSKVGKGECEVNANNVAAYNVKENKWHALGEGLNRDCSSIIFDNKSRKLYACGTFTQSGAKIIKYVAMYDIENDEWQSLKGGSVNGPCRIVLKPSEDDLYFGGLFTHAGNDDIYVSYVARYNLKNEKWYSLCGGLQGYCNAITYDSMKNKLYVGGTFTSVGTIDASINANHIAEYDIENNSWKDMDGGLNNIVHSIFYDGNSECVYVGGTFTHSFENNIQLNHIARYDLKESKWYCLENNSPNKKTPKEDNGADNVGLNGNCKVMSVDNKSLYIAGSFQIAGNITANSIVRYSLKS